MWKPCACNNWWLITSRLLLQWQIGNKRIDCLAKRAEEHIKARKYNGFQTLNLTNGRWGDQCLSVA